MKKLLLILFLFVGSFTYGQIFTQTFVDRCTGETKLVTANFSQGSAVVSFYSRVRVFTYQEFLQGQLQSWLAETYNWWNTLSPCSDAAQQAQQAQQTAQQAQQAAQQAQQAATNASTAATNATQAATTASTAATTASTAATTASTAASTASTAGTTASTATTGTSQTTTTNTSSTNTTNTTGGTTNDTSTTNTTGGTSTSGGSSSTDSSSSTDTGSSSSGEGTTSNDSGGTSEGGTSDGGETKGETKTEETKTEETKTEETKSEEKTEEVKEEKKEETKEETKEEESKEETKSEEKEEEKSDEEKEKEKSDEEKEKEKEEEEKKKKEEEEEKKKKEEEKKKEKVKMMPIQLKADAMAMQTPLGSYNAVMNFGASQSSVFGDVSYSLNTMLWDNLRQVSFMGARTKIAFTDDYQVKIIKATAVGYSNNYSISTLMLSQSFMKPFKNGMTVGVGISAGTTFESFPIKENFMVSYNVLATKSFKLNDRITYSPALIFTQTPFMSGRDGVGVDFNNGNPFGVSVRNDMRGSRIHFMGIMANSFTVQLTKRFSFNAGWTIIKGSDPNLPMMNSFMIGSKLPF
jgi:hypothetical protein